MAMGMMGDKLTGLLGEDLTSPQAQAILAAGAQMMQAGGPQVGKPVSAGQAIGKGVQAGLDQLNKQKKQQNQIGRYKQQGTMVKTGTADFAGNAVFDSQTGTTMLQLPGGQIIPMPPDVEPSTKSLFGRDLPGASTMVKLNADLRDSENSLNKLSDYLVAQGGTNKGFRRMGDQLLTNLKTFFNTDDLTPEQLQLAIAQGKSQAILGGMRVSTVGPGVMTEQDAARVLQAIGGNPDALQNPAVMGALIEDAFKYQYNIYEGQYDQLLYANDAYGRSTKPKIANPFAPKQSLPTSQGNVSFTIK
jgi:hypothetical protein